jgi:broad specificity polyphosphatase/5'/3'-nucleotidase SurE
MGWEEIRKVLISKVTCIVSSVNMGSNMGDDCIRSVHIATTTPEPILYCVTAISNEKETFITVRSHDALVSAKTIISGLMNTHI